MKFHVMGKVDLLNIIIPFFNKFPLRTSKYQDFQGFKEAMFIDTERMKEGRSYHDYELDRIAEIKKTMNRGRSFNERLKCSVDLNKEISQPAPWIQGFMDGEGCFQFIINPVVRKTKAGYSTINQFQFGVSIGQNVSEQPVLKQIELGLAKGHFTPKLGQSYEEMLKIRKQSIFMIRTVNEVQNIVIPFFEKYPMYTDKRFDFLSQKNLLTLKNSGAHLTSEGQKEMINIINGRNSRRIKPTIPSDWKTS